MPTRDGKRRSERRLDMTTPAAVIVDPGNPFIGPDYPGNLTVGKIQGPMGERLCLTIRCGPATVTVVMDRAAGKTWAAQIDQGADSMTGLIIPNGVPVKPPELP